VASTLEVDVFSSNTRLLEELNVVHLLGSDKDRLFQMEMDYHNNFLRRARLEEAVLDVREAHIYFLSLTCYESYTILLDFKVTDSLFTSQVRSDNKAFKGFLTLRARGHDKLFQLCFVVDLLNFRSSLLVLGDLL
jgi:hypothetical protein